MDFDTLVWRLSEIERKTTDGFVKQWLKDIDWELRKSGLGGLADQGMEELKGRLEFHELLSTLDVLAMHTTDRNSSESLLALGDKLVLHGVEGYKRLMDGTIVQQTKEEIEWEEKEVSKEIEMEE